MDIPLPENFKFIYIGVEDEVGTVLFREDLTSHIPVLNITLESFTKPYKWVYWVLNKNDEWVDRQDSLFLSLNPQ